MIEIRRLNRTRKEAKMEETPTGYILAALGTMSAVVVYIFRLYETFITNRLEAIEKELEQEREKREKDREEWERQRELDREEAEHDREQFLKELKLQREKIEECEQDRARLNERLKIQEGRKNG